MTKISFKECQSVLQALDQLVTHPDWSDWPQFAKLKELKSELELLAGETHPEQKTKAILATIDATVQSISQELQNTILNELPDIPPLDSPYQKPLVEDETSF